MKTLYNFDLSITILNTVTCTSTPSASRHIVAAGNTWLDVSIRGENMRGETLVAVGASRAAVAASLMLRVTSRTLGQRLCELVGSYFVVTVFTRITV